MEANDWTFPLLCDGGEVVRQYGILNEAMSQRKPEFDGIPHPTTIIVDREGIVRFKQIWVDYKKRTPTETIVSELEKLNRE